MKSSSGGVFSIGNTTGAAIPVSSGGTPAGANTQIQFNNSGSFGASGNLTWSGTALTVTGDINYTGLLKDTSDRRAKHDIRPLPPGQLQKLMRLQPVSFVMNNDPNGRTELGLIAQDVEPLYPDLVETGAGGLKSMSYPGLIAPMIEAIKEQQAEIDELWAALAAVVVAASLGLLFLRARRRRLLPVVVFAVACLAAGSSYAACSSPSGNERDIRYNGDYHTYQYCDGTNWVTLAALQPGGGGGCSNPTGNERDIRYNGDYQVYQFCNGTNWIAMTGGSCNCSGGSVNLSSGLVAYWKLDENTGTTLSDATGNGNTGTFVGATGSQWVTGKINSGLNIAGDDTNLADMGNPASLQLTTGTINAWVKSGYCNWNAGCWIVSKANAYALYDRGSADYLSAYDWGTSLERTTGVAILNNTWHMVTLTFQSGVTDGTTIYLDGTAETSFTMTVANQSSDLVIGAETTSPYHSTWTGYIDEVGVWNRALSASEVSALYNSGSGLPFSSF